MGFETELTRKTRDYVDQFLRENMKEPLPYHNFNHLEDVVHASIEIGQAMKLIEDQLEMVVIASWFHDIGYYKGWEDHELTGREIAGKFLRSQGVSEKKIEEVGGCILATRLPQRPTNILEKVVCDADLHHISSEEFFDKSELLRREVSATKKIEISEFKWYKRNLKFLKNNNYFTSYAIDRFLPVKEQNIKKLRLLIREHKEEKLKKKAYDLTGEELRLKGIPERGVETLFRITSKNHIDFSTMADNKAHIMITINSILISILFSVLFRRLEDYPNLIFPSVVLALTCLITMVFAILATRPNYTRGIFTREDIENRKTNLLFFGNFHKMPIENYEWGIKKIITDNDLLYSSMIRDIYFLGKVLGRKYQLLRISYTVFMFGFILSVIAFTLWAFYFRSAGI